ncbi:MAG: C13 family peptidase, partial [Candidatus Hodarchaeales archaeon]
MSNKSLAVVAIIIILGGLNIVQLTIFTLPELSSENTPLDVESVLDGDKEEYIGKTITLDGYYIEGGGNSSLLVTDPIVFENNSLTPSNYLMIGGSVPSSLHGQQGAQVHMTGEISWADAEEGLLSIRYSKYKLIKEGALTHLANKFVNIDYLKDELVFVPYVTTKYAVLISGGIKPEKAYSRYWNDITAMYFILTWLYGYNPANIYVVYKNGIAEDNFVPVHGPATHTYLQTVFTELEGKMGRVDDLFIYATNHGGSSGLSLWGPLDPYALTPTELKNMLSPIDYRKQIIVMEQCKSGVFIPELSQAGRVILTACSPYQSSYSCDTEGAWDEFVFHFMSAVAQFN